MKASRVWIVFLASMFFWLIVAAFSAPAMNGTDVFIFRDAGWNLASTGSFQSAALIYMPDLLPRFYSHYTPIMPLAFAGYAAIFPRNAYAGTYFNFLLGMLAAAVVLRVILSYRAGKLRSIAALTTALFPIVFITYDRPEALALAFVALTIAVATKKDSHPVLLGALIALTFLEHPYGAVIATLWVAVLLYLRNQYEPLRWIKQLVITGIVTTALLSCVALFYYWHDPSSLTRFAAHTMGIHSGLGVAIAADAKHSLSQSIHKGMSVGAISRSRYLLSWASALLLVAWCIVQRKCFRAKEWILPATGIVSVFITIVLFPAQGNYLIFVGLLIPLFLLITSHGDKPHEAKKMAGLAFALLLLAVVARIPDSIVAVIQRAEQKKSYLAAQNQPYNLKNYLHVTDATVAVEGGEYDLFKPQFHHLIELENANDANHFANLDAIANCYGAFHGQNHGARPLPSAVDAASYRKVEDAPQHLRITLFGHKVMQAEWGYGCDLYVKNSDNRVHIPSSPDISKTGRVNQNAQNNL